MQNSYPQAYAQPAYPQPQAYPQYPGYGAPGYPVPMNPMMAGYPAAQYGRASSFGYANPVPAYGMATSQHGPSFGASMIPARQAPAAQGSAFDSLL